MNRKKKLKTREIMRCLSVAALMKPPPMKNGKRMKIKFASQADAGVRPSTAIIILNVKVPTITLFVNNPDLSTQEYTSFLINRFREQFPTLEGSPVHIVYKKTQGAPKKEVTKRKTVKGRTLRPRHKPQKPLPKYHSYTAKPDKSKPSEKRKIGGKQRNWQRE